MEAKKWCRPLYPSVLQEKSTFIYQLDSEFEGAGCQHRAGSVRKAKFGFFLET
jgi:hypothetical protein